MRTPPLHTMAMLAVLVCGTAPVAGELDLVTKATTIAREYKTAMEALTGGLDAVKTLGRLRTAAVPLASLRNSNLQNRLLNRFHPVNANGIRLTGDAELNASERFRQQLSVVPAMAESLDRCVAAIVGNAPEFVLLPLDSALLAEQFLPPDVVGAFLSAADLVGRVDSLTPAEIDKLRSVLGTVMQFDSGCAEVVSNYQDDRLDRSPTLDLIRRLAPNIAHSPIKDLWTND
jgi:hypothetical protein